MKIGGKQAHLGMPHSEIKIELDWKTPICGFILQARFSTLFRIQDKAKCGKGTEIFVLEEGTPHIPS